MCGFMHSSPPKLTSIESFKNKIEYTGNCNHIKYKYVKSDHPSDVILYK